MLVVVSPAKRLDWAPRPELSMSEPDFAEEAVSLARTARRLSKPKLQALMGISADLAALNKARFEAFSDSPEPEATRPAVFAFAGDTYQGFDAGSLDADALSYAQDHMRILSGLYGLLRPLDAIQPYRLEMGSRLRTRRGPTLYAWWSDRIAMALNAAAEDVGAGVLVNCASQEYFGAVDESALRLRVITPVFLEEKEGGPKQVSFFAKRARGALARFIVERRIRDVESLTGFDSGGYAFRPDLSEGDRLVFTRAMSEQEVA